MPSGDGTPQEALPHSQGCGWPRANPRRAQRSGPGPWARSKPGRSPGLCREQLCECGPGVKPRPCGGRGQERAERAPGGNQRSGPGLKRGRNTREEQQGERASSVLPREPEFRKRRFLDGVCMTVRAQPGPCAGQPSLSRQVCP